jgi:uncharacterized protein
MRPITPSAIAKAFKCLHSWYLDCFGNPQWKRKWEEGERLEFQRGLDYERKLVSQLPGLVEPSWDGWDWESGHDSTRSLMQEGHPWIYQGALLNGHFRGKPDLLKKIDGSSRLGMYTYIPIEIKAHKQVLLKDRYQLAACAMMLEPILGSIPARGGVWLNTGEVADAELGKDTNNVVRLIEKMQEVNDGNLKTESVRCSECRRCLWSTHCENEWNSLEQVCLLYGISGKTARRFTQAGLASWRDVAVLAPQEISNRTGLKMKASISAVQHAQARQTGRPVVRGDIRFIDDIPIYFYDIETYGADVYLHGLIRIFGNEREERQFIARDPSEEGDIWRQFLDYLSRDEKAIVYCWSDYERAFVKKLKEKYSGNPKGLLHLETNLVDQCAWLRERFALPVASYSIKSVAPYFGFHWHAEDAGGLNSEAWYKDWLETRDQSILDKILRYNLDDVVAMEEIDRALRKWILKQ